MPDQPTYRSQVLDHLGLVAGMFDELGIGDVIDRATQQNPEMRDLTAGEAVKAMVLAYSGRRLPLIPVETCHRFQSKVATMVVISM